MRIKEKQRAMEEEGIRRWLEEETEEGGEIGAGEAYQAFWEWRTKQAEEGGYIFPGVVRRGRFRRVIGEMGLRVRKGQYAVRLKVEKEI